MQREYVMKSNNECPFYRNKVIYVVKSTPPDMEGLQVQCDNCGARGPIYETKEAAISGWNMASQMQQEGVFD